MIYWHSKLAVIIMIDRFFNGVVSCSLFGDRDMLCGKDDLIFTAC